MFRIFDRFILDEKDLFIIFFGVVLGAIKIFNLGPIPFRWESLIGIFIFFLVARIATTFSSTTGFVILITTALLFSIFLSPYSILIYLTILLIILKKNAQI